MSPAWPVAPGVALAAALLLCACGSEVRRTHFPDGGLWSELHFEVGLPDGRCTTWHENGAKAREGEYLHGHLHGTWRVFTSAGVRISEASYSLGQVHGITRGWYPSGRPRFRGTYVAGRQSGPWLEYFESGGVSIQGGYLDGERHGDWLAWNEDGSPKGGAHYARGSFVRKIAPEAQGPRPDAGEDGA